MSRTMAILLLMTSVCLAEVSGSNFFKLPKPMTALEAISACKNASSTLALPRKEDIETLNKTDGFGAWTGEYVDLAPWVFAKGCYNKISTTDKLQVSYSGSTCLQSCGQDILLAFVRSTNQPSNSSEEAECICGSLLDTTGISYEFCNKPCKTDGGTCGGVTNTYTTYHRCYPQARPACKADSPIEHNCMSIDLNGTMKTADCEEKHFPVCKTGKGKGSIDLKVYKTDDLQNMSWKKANKFCMDRDGVLADLSDGVGSLQGEWKRLKLNSPSPTFWISLNRAKTIPKTLMGNSTLSTSSRCLYNDKGLRKSMNCSGKAYAFCQKQNDTDLPFALTTDGTPSAANNSTPSTSNDSTPSPSNDSTPSPANNSTPSTSNDSTPSTSNDSTQSTSNDSTPSPANDSTSSPTAQPLIIYIIIPILTVVVIAVGIGIFVLRKKRKRKKTSRALQHDTRPQYDYSEIGSGQAPGTSGLQMHHIDTSATASSEGGSNIRAREHETETRDEGSYDELGNKSNLRQKSNVSTSNAYERAFPMQDGIYNEMQSEADNSTENPRDSFYATSQSCATMEGNYDEFQRRNMSNGAGGAESDYDHVIHKTN